MNNNYRTLTADFIQGVGVPRNYIPNPEIEINETSGWALGTTGTLTNNIPTGTPTFGSGASGNLSISSAASSQMRGARYLSLVSSAATTSGNCLHTSAITIDTADQAKVLTFKFYYRGTTNPTNANWSGTSSNSFGVACWDLTNSVWLPVAGNFSMTQSSGIGIATGTMQTNSNTAQLRFLIYNANATSGAVTVDFDDFFLGPQTAPIGPVATDPVSWTPTGSWSSNTTYTGYKWRVGKWGFYQVKVALAGAPTSASLTINLPSGEVIDTSFLTSTADTVVMPQSNVQIDDTSTNYFPGQVCYSSTTAVAVRYLNSASGTNPVNIVDNNSVTQIAPVTFGNGDSITVSWAAPIAGWSSNVQMSNDTDTRVVAAIISGDPASATSGNPIIVPTITIDTHAAYSTSTGRYTVPVTGIYKMYGALQSASSATTLTIYKNAVSTALAGNLDSNGEATYAGAVNCSAGDIIDIRPGGTVDATNMTLNIERLSGPAVVAATEIVSASYGLTTVQTVGTNAVLKYDTKVVDTHNAYSTSTGLFTAPVSGIYELNCNFNKSSSGGTYIKKNGSAAGYVGTANSNTFVSGGLTVSLNAGDTIGLYNDTSGDYAATSGNGFINSFYIMRLNN
jgi:hypothetical protein